MTFTKTTRLISGSAITFFAHSSIEAHDETLSIYSLLRFGTLTLVLINLVPSCALFLPVKLAAFKRLANLRCCIRLVIFCFIGSLTRFV
jgi:hypothetical protein